MKICSNCQIEKRIDQFYKHSRYKDGHQGVCKECQRVRSREREPLKGEIYSKYRSSRKGKESHNKCQKEYTKRHPEKCKAHRIVRYAIIKGELIRDVCSICGKRDAHAHHDNYSQPLVVRWLCKKHHDQHHRILVGG